LRYVSTTGRTPPVSLEEAVFSGPAPDGGLYVPERLPRLRTLPPFGRSLADTAFSVAEGLFGEDVPGEILREIVEESLDFEIPLVPVGSAEGQQRLYALELFHGPTLAFKDVGARFMARLMLHFLKRRGRDCTVLVATSGDTGSAVAHAFYRLEGIRVVVLFPRGKVSPLQRRLFSTLGDNVSSLEVDGTFDDCQRLVKQAFADPGLTARRPLVSANSINVGRLLPQTFYYFHILAQLPRTSPGPLLISTPSGNFGNLTAGLFAKRMGLPCETFVAATNVNDVVPEYLKGGVFTPRPSVATLSNAMDVGNPSNFARILWLYRSSLDDLRRDLVGSVHTDEETLSAIAEVHRRSGYLLDPHTAVGYLGAREALEGESSEVTAVVLATAHPAKFRETVERALGESIPLPPALAAVAEREERLVPLPAEYRALKEYMTS
jgi:threonine synthase